MYNIQTPYHMRYFFVNERMSIMEEFNLDPAVLQRFSAYLEANEDAKAASVATEQAHNANNEIINDGFGDD